jgi:hypothetical protein
VVYINENGMDINECGISVDRSCNTIGFAVGKMINVNEINVLLIKEK